MLSKRTAILAIFGGVLAKMAHADEPPKADRLVLNNSESLWNGPMTWTVNLDQMKSLDVFLDGKKATISPADLFAAINSQTMPDCERPAGVTDDEAIRFFAVSMALELDVNVDRAEQAVRNLIARGLIERSAENANA